MSEKKYVRNHAVNEILNDMSNEKKTVFEDIVDRTAEFAESQGMKLGAKTKEAVQKMVKDVALEEGMSIGTGVEGEPVINVAGHTAERWKVLAGVESPAAAAAAVGPEPPPFSIPINDLNRTVEVAPGILVSEHLIRDAVNATSVPGEIDRVEARENAKKRMFDELRQDIDASKRVVQSMIERIKNPPNLQEKFISFDAMPASLQRVVNAYIAASDANRELDEAIKALAAEPRSSS